MKGVKGVMGVEGVKDNSSVPFWAKTESILRQNGVRFAAK